MHDNSKSYQSGIEISLWGFHRLVCNDSKSYQSGIEMKK